MVIAALVLEAAQHRKRKPCSSKSNKEFARKAF
jgi:hypothetical protein